MKRLYINTQAQRDEKLYKRIEKNLDEIIAIKNNILTKKYVKPVTQEEIKRLRKFIEQDTKLAYTVDSNDLYRMARILGFIERDETM
jgi:hypothetical protein